MATKEKNQKAQLPAGFEDAAPKEWWVNIEPGVIVQGVLLDVDSKKRRDKMTEYMKIRLTAVPGPITVTKGSEKTEDLETKTPAIGDIVCVDVRSRLEKLAALADDSSHLWEVYIRTLEKADIEGGQTLWNFQTGKKPAGKRENATGNPIR